MSQLKAHVQRNLDLYLSRLYEYLRFPSVSADPARRSDIAACARWLADYLGELLGEVEVNDRFGLPVVRAATKRDPAKPTVLLYGHYDVQPARVEDGWRTPPFEPTLVDGRIIGRGAADNKGPLLTYLFGLELAKRQGELPVNLIVLVEGEEESTGQALGRFIAANRSRLTAEAILNTDSGGLLPARPALTYGTRGIVYKQIDLEGANQDLHSGAFGGLVPNPAEALVHLLGELAGSDGRINIPELYDRVRPIDPDEHQQFLELEYDIEGLKTRFDLRELAGETEFLPVERLWCRPNLCINGLVGGYTGEGSKTVLPSRASAKFSVRIVPDQDPGEVSDLIDRRLNELADPGVKMTIRTLGLAEPYLGPRTGPLVEAARSACREAGGVEPATIREGGTIPILRELEQAISPNILMLGFSRPDCGAHGPGEYYHLDDFALGIETVALLIAKLGGLK